MNPIELAEGEVVEPEVIGPTTSLEQFLELPDIEEAPAWEFVDGRMVRKAMPGGKHSVLQRAFGVELNHFAGPRRLGEALPELRCTFGGRSIVPDVTFFRDEHIEIDEDGEVCDEVLIAPDLMIEILSPKQSPRILEDRIRHALDHGCPLGWLVHTYGERISVHRPGVEVLELGIDDVLEGEPVLPGFRLPVAEVFGWLKLRRRSGGS